MNSSGSNIWSANHFWHRRLSGPGTLSNSVVAVSIVCAMMLFLTACAEPTPEIMPTSESMSTPVATPKEVLPPTLSATPIPFFLQAEYDQQGSLTSVIGPDGDEVTDNSLAQVFPVELDAGTPPDAWEAEATGISGLSTLDAAYYDDTTRELVFIGQPCITDCSGLRFDDLLVAFQSVYSNSPPAVSIDPGPSAEVMNVRYIGPTENTHFGEVMFEADRVMKNLGSGEDNETRQSMVVTNMPDHKNLLELGLVLAPPTESGQAESRHRFWIVVARADLVVDDTSFEFEEFDLRINTEYLDANWQPFPDPASAPDDPAAQAFAQQLTEHYEGYAKDFPVFSDLTNLARMVSLAEWTLHAGIPIQQEGPLLTVTPTGYPTDQSTPAITVSKTTTKTTTQTTAAGIETLTDTRTQMIWGGVDLAPQNDYKAATGPLELTSVAAQSRPNPSTRQWPVRDGVLRAATVPLSYVKRVGAYRKVIEPARLQSGSIIFDLSYNSMQSEIYGLGRSWESSLPRLMTPKDKLLYEPLGRFYPEVTLVDPRANTSINFVGPFVEQGSGRVVYQNSNDATDLVEVQPNGDLVWENQTGKRLTFSGQGRLLSFVAPDGGMTLAYNDNGSLRSIEAASGEKRLFEYGPTGLLTRIHGSTETAQPLVSLTYDDRNRLTETRDGTGNLISAQYYSGLRILAYWANKILLIFDWRQPDHPRVYSVDADGQTFVETFGPTELERFAKVILLSGHKDALGTVVYLRIADAKALIMMDGRILELTADVATNPGRLREELGKHGMLPPSNSKIFIADGDGDKVNFSEVFEDSLVLDSEGLEEDIIVERVRNAPSSPISPEDSRIFIAVPGKDDLLNVGFDQTDKDQWQPDLWQEILESAEAAVSKIGPYRITRREPGVKMSDQFVQALIEAKQPIVVMAHSDGESIYFPDGSRFMPEAVDSITRDDIGRNSPVVVLLACEGARVQNTASLAKKLSDLGAGLTIAPATSIRPGSTSELLSTFLQNSLDQDVLSAFREALRQFSPEIFSDKHYRIIFGWIPPTHRKSGPEDSNVVA